MKDTVDAPSYIIDVCKTIPINDSEVGAQWKAFTLDDIIIMHAVYAWRPKVVVKKEVLRTQSCMSDQHVYT